MAHDHIPFCFPVTLTMELILEPSYLQTTNTMDVDAADVPRSPGASDGDGHQKLLPRLQESSENFQTLQNSR